MRIYNTAVEADKPQPVAKDEVLEETLQDPPVENLPTINENLEIAEKEEMISSTNEHQVTHTLPVD